MVANSNTCNTCNSPFKWFLKILLLIVLMFILVSSLYYYYKYKTNYDNTNYDNNKDKSKVT